MTDEQVAGAKKQLLSDVYTLMEDPLQLVENMGVQVRECLFRCIIAILHGMRRTLHKVFSCL